MTSQFVRIEKITEHSILPVMWNMTIVIESIIYKINLNTGGRWRSKLEFKSFTISLY